ncbi:MULTISPECIES: TetR/AcrR family transcriptional regulator [Microbacterium]|uniref:TetR/AcrR family transcriptional regulator n=1 Tax=Microbacterium TaxID=33882 RepID=UPI00217DE2C5|nr:MULTISPECIES: TetR/AcrR family transcriptional regulator [Microbacterium]UWF78368.1 TetR family transcriptional regulator [Microbacterium neungamense]WCM56545.1 TetR family transcriptional regulator [Microbacterium sp. EF45047]
MSLSDPRSARRGRPGHDRAHVLSTAVGLFNEQGYDATSVADLARRLGVTKSALYHHFDSKEQLLEIALEDALGALEQALDDALGEPTPAARLSEVIRGAVRVLIDKQSEVTLLLRLRGNSPVELAALERRRAFDHRVTQLVRDAQSEGLIRGDLDAGTATRLVFGMINSLVEWYRPGGRIDPELLAEEVLAVSMDGLRPRRED